MIPWSELDGDVIERLVASLIALDHPRANRITPSRGDRGMDIRVRQDDGTLVIYQVKRYTGPLTTRQAQEIEKSLQTMHQHVAAEHDVAAWHLVMPWDPTPERIAWLEDDLAKRIDPIELRWDDKARLDTWASAHPNLLDYFLPGRSPRDELLLEALRSRLPDPSTVEGADLLGVATAHSLHVQRALDRVDPFYRYEVQHHPDMAAARAAENAAAGRAGLAMMQTVGLAGGEARTVAMYAKTALSAELSPITINTTIHVPDEHRASFESFHDYGTALVGVPATVEAVGGPPGLDAPAGEYTVTLSPWPEEADLPDTELAILDTDGTELATIPLGRFQRTRGLDGRGVQLRARAVGGSSMFTFSIRASEDGRTFTARMGLEAPSLTGMAPAAAARAARAFAAYLQAGRHQWRVADAGRVLHEAKREEPLDDGGQFRPLVLDYLDSLATLQRHLSERVVVPDLSTEPIEAANEVIAAARLLNGETLHVPMDIWVERTSWEATGAAPVRIAQQMHCTVAGRKIPIMALVEAETVEAVEAPAGPSDPVKVAPPGGLFAVTLHRPDPTAR
ncbi:hypothetical protein CHO01_21930 [Cellulomonas hominis]|uniref:Restriction endonuclease type IV Mrr domain-containing protein n=1 Tax=Cellulomonas hominis TaxID=156981 RepID=A0A511FFG1_9CELL|nr:restriction endonuclease [Cellulomonas hominis]MBB5474683.1 hypothetical protein [Cellulomonas hominis]NKY05749.1 restriction endonuclease [Cellulomonas hominis]GEL47077.1 hypothetical protein CHO01_21930 [Cellulomonas hominis]